MVPWFFYIILGSLQGILEWLPVSSEGQLVVTATWMGFEDAAIAIRLAFWLHLGTMASVLFIYRNTWRQILDLRDKSHDFSREFLVITTIGTAIVGIPIRLILFDKINWTIVSSVLLIIIAFALFLTAVFLRYSSLTEGAQEILSLSKIQMLIIGMAQGLSIIPGISRSGITVAALLMAKVEKSQSLEYSFHMSVLASLGAIGLDLIAVIVLNEQIIEGLSIIGVLLAIVLAFFFGVISMRFLIDLVAKYDFSIITFSLGLIILIFEIIRLVSIS